MQVGDRAKYTLTIFEYRHVWANYQSKNEKKVKEYTVTIVKTYPECSLIEFKGGSRKIVNNKYLSKG